MGNRGVQDGRVGPASAAAVFVELGLDIGLSIGACLALELVERAVVALDAHLPVAREQLRLIAQLLAIALDRLAIGSGFLVRGRGLAGGVALFWGGRAVARWSLAVAVAAALGEIAWLLSQSPNHRHALFLGDLEWLVMPPLMQGQYRLFYAQKRPVGVALWAFVSEEVEQRLAGGGRLGSNDWRSGDRVWLVEIVAPFGNQEKMLEDLRKTALADRKFRYIRVQPNGKRETVEVMGDSVK